MLDRIRIRTLREAGHTLEEIASTVGVSKSSVRRVLQEPAFQSPDSAPTPQSQRLGRPSTAQTFHKEVERILESVPC
jgi:transposase